MKTVEEIIKNIKRNKEEIEFLPTGFHQLDSFLDGGFMPREFIVIGAPTGQGKSFLAGQILFNIVQKGFKGAYFSLEISNEMVVSRLIGATSNIKPTRLIAGFLSPKENDARSKAEAEILCYNRSMNFYDDLYELNAIASEIMKEKYEFAVIDFIQNVYAEEAEEYERLSTASIKLQKLAKSSNACILAISQLSNSAARDKDPDSQLEYKGSGGIATACDLGFIIHQERINENESHITLKLRKNRRGFAGVEFPLRFVHPGGQIIESSV